MAKADFEHTQELWNVEREAFDYLVDEVGLLDTAAVREMNEQICAGYLAVNVNDHSPPPTLWVMGQLVLRLVGGRPQVVEIGPMDPGPYLYTVAANDMRRLWPTPQPAAVEPSRGKRQPAAHNRALETLKLLGPRIKPGMQPHEVHKLVKSEYARHGNDETVSRRTVVRAYRAHLVNIAK